MDILSIISIIINYIWDAFKLLIQTVFVAPFKNYNMFWILVPIYLAWIFADYFQEKRGTSIGNAISNGVIALWAGIDWLRTTINTMIDGGKNVFIHLLGKFFLAALVLLYGIIIIYGGAKGKPLSKRIGRIRIVTYIVGIFTPVFYDVTPLSFQLIFAAIIFFPLFYFIVEFLDNLMPDPQSIINEPRKY